MVIDDLLVKLRDRNAVIAIVGLGYVGLPLVLRFVEVGYRVVGIDIDPVKVEICSFNLHLQPIVKDCEMAKLTNALQL